jgi:glycosyltransferase involved in cell wall biosynthesis
MKRIGISCEFIGTKLNGTATYSRNLLYGLAQLHGDQHYTAYLSSPLALPAVPQADHMTARMVLPYNAWLRIPVTMPIELLRHPVDLLHTQNWAPPWLPCPLVVTTHDVVWQSHPEMFPPGLGTRVRMLARRTSQRAQRVITSSHYSASDIMQQHGISAEKMRVIHLPVDPRMQRVEDPTQIASVCQRYQIDRPYILYVGSIEPRKNIGQLIRAFAQVRRTYNVPHQLVIAGKPLYLYEHDLALPAQLGIAGDVRFTGQVRDTDLPALYSGASLFATLPLYEGFGLPPLEAMACGVPVLAANTTSLPEALGDGALLVDPRRLELVAPLMAQMLLNSALQGEMRARGERWVRQFEPVRLARQVAAVYQECIEQSQHSTHKVHFVSWR